MNDVLIPVQQLITKLQNEAPNKKLELEVDRLERLIVQMTHHKGALEETKSVWLPIVKRRITPK